MTILSAVSDVMWIVVFDIGCCDLPFAQSLRMVVWKDAAAMVVMMIRALHKKLHK